MNRKEFRSGTNQLIGFVLVGLGVLFLLGQIFNINVMSLFDFGWWQVSWPLYVIIPGAIIIVLGVISGIYNFITSE
jgi:hypothetical protein